MDTSEISGALSKLLEDPTALANAMSIASSLMGSPPTSAPPTPPSSSEPTNTAGETDEAVNASAPPTSDGTVGDAPSIAAIANLLGGGSQKGDPRCALLYALKPYMGHGRAEKIDTLVNMLRLADLAGGMLGGKLF